MWSDTIPERPTLDKDALLLLGRTECLWDGDELARSLRDSGRELSAKPFVLLLLRQRKRFSCDETLTTSWVPDEHTTLNFLGSKITDLLWSLLMTWINSGYIYIHIYGFLRGKETSNTQGETERTNVSKEILFKPSGIGKNTGNTLF